MITRNLKPTDVGANGFTIPNMVQRKDSDKRSGGYKRNGFVGADGKNLVFKRQIWYNQTNAVYLLVPSIETNPSSEPSSPIPGKMCTSFF